jgi:hypothetical protein
MSGIMRASSSPMWMRVIFPMSMQMFMDCFAMKMHMFVNQVDAEKKRQIV